MNKLLLFFYSILLLAIKAKAEYVSGYEILSQYLNPSGKIQLNASGNTTFQVKIGFQRAYVSGSLESANMDVQIVAYKHSTSNGFPQIVQQLVTPFKITTNDFPPDPWGGSYDYVEKTYTITVPGSLNSQVAAGLYLQVLWKGQGYNAGGTPSGTPFFPMRYTNKAYQFSQAPPPPAVPNDDYTGAISLISDSGIPINGTSYQATPSSQLLPTCISQSNRPDVWYKFQATSTKHTIKLGNVGYHGSTSSWAPLVGLVLYNSQMVEMSCTIDRIIHNNWLNVGETYYVRFVDADYTTNPAKNFNISVSTMADNVITKLSSQSYNLFSSKITASFLHDPSIPASDITFEWEIVPPASDEADHFDISLSVGSLTYEAYIDALEGDTATRVRVRMRRISTNQPISDWYITPNLIWFG